MELFSEVYGCYFTVVSRILREAEKGLTKTEIEQLVKNHGFYESTLHLLPALFSGEWNLLHEENKIYYSKLSGNTKRPLTTLEKAWLKALISDVRIRLFLDDEGLRLLETELCGIEPLFLPDDFHIYDKHRDGDNYSDSGYIERFKSILRAAKQQKVLNIEYDSGKKKRTSGLYLPYKLLYSTRDDKFRLLCSAINQKKRKSGQVILNLARVISINVSDSGFFPTAGFKEYPCPEFVTLEISRERNALERCMLQFASFERQTEYDKNRDIYICRIWYDHADETELLIRILSFGPAVKVIGNEVFLRQVRERVRRQMMLFEKI